jgi:hypothetical protein
MAGNKVVLDGELVRRLRERRGLSSQGDLARATVLLDPKRGGLAPRTIWDAENRKPVTRRTQLLVARVLEIADPDELLATSHRAALGPKPALSSSSRWRPATMVAALSLCIIGGSVALWPQFKPETTSAPSLDGAEVGLDTAIWTVNGPAAKAALANMDTPRARVVQPTLSFSPTTGLGMSGIDGTYEQTGIQTVTPFRPPFIVSATVMATTINAGAFQLLVTSADGGRGVALIGGQGGNDVFTGLTLQSPSGPGTHWKLRGKLSEPRAPTRNVWYHLAISVDAAGTAMAIAAPQGAEPRRRSIPALGAGPFYVLLSQGSGAHGPGPNHAYWRSVTISRRDTVTALRLWRGAHRSRAPDAVALSARNER